MLTRLMTPKEVMAFYKISEGTLRKYRVYGKGFKYVKIGGRIFYTRIKPRGLAPWM